MKILLNGASGRMGKTIIDVVRKSYYDIEIIPVDIKGEGVYKICDVKDFDCVVDFSTLSGFKDSLRHAVDFSKPFVSGTTGISEEELKLIEEASKKIAVLYSPNMSIGVNICFYIVDQISKRIKCDVFIKEVHHKMKKDKPSGTALKFKQIIEKNALCVDIAAIRAGDVIGEHEISFVMEGERITLSHMALTREIFARGAIECAKWIYSKEKGFYTFADFLGF
ncbi:MAG: 4-hydroxy-tetrahydrodipicolinate reductase [Elusimicrobiales bacterium]